MRLRQLTNKKLNPNMYNTGGYKSRYNIGRIRKFPTGGMYQDNTAQSVGQGGGPLNTANIVYQESDPALQTQRLKGMQAEEERLKTADAYTVQQIDQMLAEGKITAEQAGTLKAQQTRDQLATIESAGKAGLQTVAQGAQVAGVLDDAGGMKGALAGASTAKNLSQLATLAQGMDAAAIAGEAGTALAAEVMAAGGTVMSSAETGKTIVIDAGGNVVKAGSGIGAGLKSFASSGAGLGLISTGLGYGVDALWGDDDPTTSTAGDIGGSVLKSAGTGASIGSYFGPVGTLVGGVGGALYGLGSELFGSAKARKKQKEAEEKAEREYKAEVKKVVTAHNKDLMENFASQRSMVRAGALKQKTYSGYDLGRNVVAQMGGLRMGTPRYGYAA